MSDFDDLFKSRLEGHEVEVPDDMWSRIQNAQDSKDVRKSPFPYLRIGALVFLLTFVAGSSYLFLSTNNAEDVVSHLDANSDASNSFANYLLTDQNTNTSVLKAKIENSDILPEKNSQVKSIYADNKIKASTTTFAIPLTKQVLETNPNSLTDSNSSINEGLSSSSNNNSNSNGSTAISFTSNEKYSTTTLISKTIDQLENTSRLAELYLLPDYDKKCPKFGKNSSFHGYFSVEAYHSSDKIFRSFETHDEELNPYLNLRTTTETARYSYSNGVRLKWHNSSGFALGLGIDRNVINERFNFTQDGAREIKTIISIDTIFSSDGSFTTAADTTRVEIQGVKTNIISNSYTSVDLPIHLSYQREFGKWAVGLSGGVYVNLFFDQKGRILNFNNEPSWISSGEEQELDIYRPNSGVKFDGAITVIYHLTPSIDIMAEPYFKYNPNSFTRENHPLKQYYNTMGIRTGLRYNFGF